jgi:SAM-dependent methyltransferase
MTPKGLYSKLEQEFCGKELLEVGVGMRKFPGAIGVDIRGNSQADVFHDLNTFPYPFPNDRFDSLLCRHVLEHLEETDKVMEEFFRILKPGGEAIIEVPHYTHVEAYRHWQHRHFFTMGSLDYFLPGNMHYKACFEIRYRHLFFDDISRVLGIEWLANRFTRAYERHFAYIFPAGSIVWRLEAIKDGGTSA